MSPYTSNQSNKGKRVIVIAKRKKSNGVVAFVIVAVIVVLVFGAGLKLRQYVVNRFDSSATATTQSTSASQGLTDAQQAFIKKMAAPAQRVYKLNRQVLPSIVVAQAILESNWGKSTLYLEANNPFGMKGSYEGNTKAFPTTEYENGKKITVNDYFRDYPDLKSAILDHDKILRAKFIPQATTNYQTAAEFLQENNYATDPNYAQKIIQMIQTYNLNQYDN